MVWTDCLWTHHQLDLLSLNTSWFGPTVFEHVMVWTYCLWTHHGLDRLSLNTSWFGPTVFEHVMVWTYCLWTRHGLDLLSLNTSWIGPTVFVGAESGRAGVGELDDVRARPPGGFWQHVGRVAGLQVAQRARQVAQRRWGPDAVAAPLLVATEPATRRREEAQSVPSRIHFYRTALRFFGSLNSVRRFFFILHFVFCFFVEPEMVPWRTIFYGSLRRLYRFFEEPFKDMVL